jgi:hypothetical protein
MGLCVRHRPGRIDEIAGRNMVRCGYILNRRSDWIWFLGLPFLAIAVALACHRWLPVMALASVGLWITMPHHLATWLRTYGLREDWERWKGPLVVGPAVVLGTTLLGMRVAPQTLLGLTLLWDHQHSLMQQHGLARIYDFKARTGGPTTGRFDLLLNWFLYVNMLITAPLFVRLWGPWLFESSLPLKAEWFVWAQSLSWAATAAFLVAYAVHAIRCARAGHALNPVKYQFIGSSYFLWYFTSWHTDSLLVFGIAHRLMHGVQYIVIVNSYLGRKLENAERPAFAGENSARAPAVTLASIGQLFKSHRVLTFIGLGLIYVLLYQLLVLRPFDEFGFGVVNFMGVGPAPHPMPDVTRARGYDLFAATMIQALPVTHYYFDSFIWKVSDARVQQGL